MEFKVNLPLTSAHTLFITSFLSTHSTQGPGTPCDAMPGAT